MTDEEKFWAGMLLYMYHFFQLILSIIFQYQAHPRAMAKVLDTVSKFTKIQKYIKDMPIENFQL